MATEIQLVYSDVSTRRIVRISDFTSLTCPADLEDTYWKLQHSKSIPNEVYNTPSMWELTQGRKFKKHDINIQLADIERFELLDKKADCLEQLSKLLNNMRFTRAVNMVGWNQLMPAYQLEIEEYRATSEIGPLLASMASDENLPVAIAEFEVKNNTYLDFLITNETIWNKWSRKIKMSKDPVYVLDVFKSSIAISK